MERGTADVASGDGGASRDERLIRGQCANDLLRQKGFARASSTGEKDGLTPADLWALEECIQ